MFCRFGPELERCILRGACVVSVARVGAKFADTLGFQKNSAIPQPDALRAYTQSESTCTGICIFLPRDPWPKQGGTHCNIRVANLRLALYGHPLPGAFWEEVHG